MKAPKAWTNGSEIVGLFVGDWAPKSPPTNEGIECAEEKDVSDDALEDDDEREIGGALTLSLNEIEDLMWDEMKIRMMNEFKKQRYVPNVHC